LVFIKQEIVPLHPPSPKTPAYNQTWSASGYSLQRYGGGSVHTRIRTAVAFGKYSTKKWNANCTVCTYYSTAV